MSARSFVVPTSYDDWRTTDPRESEPDTGRRCDAAVREVDAAEQAYFDARDGVRDPALAYRVARRCIGAARDAGHAIVRADWIKAARLWRGLARSLRQNQRSAA